MGFWRTEALEIVPFQVRCSLLIGAHLTFFAHWRTEALEIVPFHVRCSLRHIYPRSAAN